ncbi:MAG: saccharopine dehydrogenase NADP-binding domain-containing protein [Solirubrobacteraceae bacterium]|nr:saccharopine dehydrogenase NADP-binding domain-containing protein [Solirubrobacteraceae bacterium]
MRDASETDFDLVQFGATGFAGGLTADYLAEHAPPELRWAIAGRGRARLEAVARRVGELAPDRPEPQVIEIQLDDDDAVAALVGRARLVLTTVGPYAIHGEPLVAACARAGTDYVDITGEPQFVDDMYLRYHEDAERTGARLVHCAGFDSVPHDLGAMLCAQQFSGDEPLKITGAVRANAEFSGGTFQSAIGGFGALRASAKLASQRRTVEAGRSSSNRRVHVRAGAPYKDPATGKWLAPLPTIDPQIVVRSAAALPFYGPDFTYDHRMAAKRLSTVVGLGAGVGVLLVATAIPPLRTQLAKIKSSGTGPDAERRARSWFNVRMTGESASHRAVVEVRGGDPGYDETAKMVAETSLSLLLDDNPDVSGQVTTAVACGGALLGRLRAAGIAFEVLEGARTPASTHT